MNEVWPVWSPLPTIQLPDAFELQVKVAPIMAAKKTAGDAFEPASFTLSLKHHRSYDDQSCNPLPSTARLEGAIQRTIANMLKRRGLHVTDSSVTVRGPECSVPNVRISSHSECYQYWDITVTVT